MKTRMQPTRRIAPNPPKKYPEIFRALLEGGRDGLFGPYFVVACCTASGLRPCVGEVLSLLKTVSGVMVCQSSPPSSRKY